jgi:hypothetical protein
MMRMMRLWKVLACTMALVLAVTPSAAAFAQAAPAPAAQTTPASPRLRGAVMDPTGGLMPSVDIAILRGATVLRAGKTDATGNFSFDIAPGEYQLAVTAPDFKVYTQTVRVAANMRPLAITMSLEGITSVIEVREGGANSEVVVDASSSLDATTITAEQLKDLPDNEEDLLKYLQMLAGGEGNAQLIIDGFEGGRMPTRDEIARIVIEPNSFNATGTGPRITIVSRNPGPTRWAGNARLTYRDSALNARTKGTVNKTPMHRTTINTSYNGPVIKGKWGLSVSMNRTQSEAGANALRAITLAGPVNSSFVSPSTTESITLQNQFFLSQTNQLRVMFGYNRSKTRNGGIGGITLPERASNNDNSGWNLQVQNNVTLSSRMTNNFNFRVQRNNQSTRPVTSAVAINVLDAFNGGGAQNLSDTRGTSFNLNNNVQWQPTQKWNFQLAFTANYASNYNYSENNYLGTFTFSSLEDYANGIARTFQKTSGNPLAETTHMDANISLQGSYRISANMSGGFGAQYSVQNHFKDYNNFSPTANLQFQIPKSKTTMSVGVRMTHGNLPVNIYEQLLRGDGTTQQFTTVISNPSYPDPFEGGEEGVTTGQGNSITVRGPNFETPYTLNSQVSVTQQFLKNWRVSTALQVNRQVHGVRTRNINAPFPGTPLDPTMTRDEIDRLRPYFPLVGRVNQYESVGNSLSKNLSFTVQVPSTTKKFLGTTFGSPYFRYGLTWAADDSQPTNVYNVRGDWARNDQRHQFQTSFSIRPPKVGNFSFDMNANSGRTYSITTGKDENFDQAFNDRPAGVKRNSLRGPGAWYANMTWSSNPIMFRKAPKPAAVAAGAPGAPPPGGAAAVALPAQLSNVDQLIQSAMAAGLPPATINSLIASMSSQPGFTSGPATPVVQPTLSNPRMTFSVQVSNLFNHANPNSYSGVLTSPFFGKPQSWSPGRAITLSLNSNF